MKNLNFIILAIASLFFSCDLDPVPLKDTFEQTYADFPPLIDGVQCDNGDYLVIGNKVTNGKGDFFIARLDVQGAVKDSKTFDIAGDEEIVCMTKDENCNVYIGGRDKSDTTCIWFQIKTANNTLEKGWSKKEKCTFHTRISKIEYMNGQLYCIRGLAPNPPSSVAFKTGYFRANPSDGSVDLACSNNIGFGYYGAWASSINVDNKDRIVYGGENGATVMLTVFNPSVCSTPITKSNFNTTPFNLTRGIVANSEAIFVGGGILKDGTGGKFVTYNFFLKLNYNLDLSNPSTSRVIDSTNLTIGNLRYYELKGFVFSSKNKSQLVYASAYAIANDSKEYTEVVSLNTLIFGKIWDSPRVHNISTNKLLSVNDGGYLLIGQLNTTTGRVIKINTEGKL